MGRRKLAKEHRLPSAHAVLPGPGKVAIEWVDEDGRPTVLWVPVHRVAGLAMALVRAGQRSQSVSAVPRPRAPR